MKNKRISFFGMLLAALLLLMTGCAQNTPRELSDMEETAVVQTLTAMAPTLPPPTETPTPTATNTPTPTPTLVTSIGPDNFPADVNPLTGLQVENPNLLNRRPVIVKVANYPAVGRPHAGLSYADIVWEYYIGEGSNRFAALYYGQDGEKIGPVRSGRLVDPELARMYQAVLAFSGANQENVLPRIYDLLGNRILTEGNCPGLCRDDYTVVGVFANSADITAQMEARGVTQSKPDLTGMLFDTKLPAGGKNAEKATLFYNFLDKGDWVYDETSGKYLRWIENADNYEQMIPLVDRLNNQQLAFSNVIMAYATYTEYSSVLHDIAVWDNTGGMPAVVFRDGKAYEVTWKATNQEKPIQFFDAQGNLFPLKPGNTWINLVGSNTTLEVTDSEWFFTFRMP
ncbi:MAG: DUF3048 domain-containing protein [Chloroflexi bacterium]|nr:DUF3048 domain-containing protein [Anaerolineaceae bacterium]NLI44011.1 DUF3048 domain-containing protein [Chloroflexota bacterium]HOE34267.1 DUF3048 domain-containing protein [Anaerolineaceae bacterium]HOT25893.1 DUF3048 domain-containing protein [Anaerolineaceae bacterium]HQH58042.1 DUF3048 domain-containing protein [Anaerolineaceae bacterium]